MKMWMSKLARLSWPMLVCMLALAVIGVRLIQSAGGVRASAALQGLWSVHAWTAALGLAICIALAMVDYGLLLTFVCFFIFSGNMGRLPTVRGFFSSLLEKNTLLTAVFSCQLISNVPSAILLSQFTENYASLLTGVNIGGAGTLIASLASLITFREYASHYPEGVKGYILRFAALNFGFLIVMTCFCVAIGR